MKTGEMDQLITLQSVTETNTLGSSVPVFTSVAEVWAKVITERGSTAFEAARNNARETIRVGMRYRSDVVTSWRILWEGRAYNVVHVDRSERRSKGLLWVTAQVIEAT